MGVFQQREWKNTKQMYQAFIPTLLKNKELFIDKWRGAFELLDAQIKKCQLEVEQLSPNIFDRYLAGGTVLKELRLVSKKRLFLNQAVPFNADLEAEINNMHMASYRLGVDLGVTSNSINIETLKRMHGCIKNDQNNSGTIRRGQGWIGGNSPLDAFYVCPPADQIEHLLQDLCEFINRDDLPISLIAAVAQVQLCIIHPFSDGNGRLARMLTEVIYRKSGIVKFVSPPINLVRLSQLELDFVAAIKDFEKDDVSSLYDFWLTASEWAICEIKDIAEHQELLKQELLNRVSVLQRTKEINTIIDIIIDQPIVTSVLIADKLKINSSHAEKLLLVLKKFGVLQAHKLRKPEGLIIFDSSHSIACHHSIERRYFDS